MAGSNESEKKELPGKRSVSLGWLAESGVMPKKQKAIEGVGASSAVELKAQLYKSQEEQARIEEGLEVERKTRRGASQIFTQKNSGVEERANRCLPITKSFFVF